MFGKIRILKLCLIAALTVHLIITISSVLYGIYQLNQEENQREKTGDPYYDPSDYRFNRLVLVGIGAVTVLMISLGMIGALTLSYCLLIFFGSSGVGIILLISIVLVIEKFISAIFGTFLFLGAILTFFLTFYLASEVNIYKKYLSANNPLEILANNM